MPCVLRTDSSVSEPIAFVPQVCIQTIYILPPTRTLILTLLYITVYSLCLPLHFLLIPHYSLCPSTLYSYLFDPFILMTYLFCMTQVV